MIARLMAVGVLGGLLTGCVGPTVVLVKNPQTGEIVQCKGTLSGIAPIAESIVARDCAAGYVAAGWTRMN